MATPIPRNEVTFTLGEIAGATGGRVVAGDAAARIRGVVTDSREVRPGVLFVALRGETHDAHAFVPQATTAGATAVLVERGNVTLPEGQCHVEVDDTTRALGELGRAHRRRWGRRVVGITGSAGKTTTKELTAAGLRGTGLRVHATIGNLNNLIGVPMTLFGLDETHDVAVVEMGTSRPGEIARLAEIAAPDVGVVTLAAPAHTEGLGSLEAVAAEKGAMFGALAETGVAVANADDAPTRTYAALSRAERRITFGRSADADVRLVAREMDRTARSRCTYEIRGGGAVSLALRLIGEGAAIDAAAALAVVIAIAGMESVRPAGAAMEAVDPTPGRLVPIERADGTVILDDTYNASPRSTMLSIDAAADLARARGARAVAVLGDMKELGARSRDEHAAVGQHAAARGIAVVIACGPESAALGAGEHVADAPAAAVRAREVVRPGDVVLVKGSRSMRMERVVSALTEGA